MSNQKIRHWIYLALGFLILVGIAWFFVLREPKFTDEYICNEIYSVHSDDFKNVYSYLSGKDVIADITAIPTIDHSFGIPTEDSNDYRAYNDSIIRLFHTEISEIVSAEDYMLFYTKKSGGLLNQEYVILACGNTPPVMKETPQNSISGTKWVYYIVNAED